MDRFTVFCRTEAGDKAIASAQDVQDKLSRALLEAVDGFSTVGELSSRIGEASSALAALTALETAGLIETLDARMARVAGQESRWVSASGGLSVGGKASSSPLSVPQGVEPFSGFGADSLAPVLPAGREPVRSEPARSEGTKFKVASGSKASILDRIRAFFGNIGHEMLAGAGARGRAIRRTVLITASLLTLVVVGFAAVVLLQQLSTLRERVERSAAQWTGEPVRIASVGIGFHPWPAFVLKDIQIGEGGRSRIGSAWGYPDWIKWAMGKRQSLGITITDATIESSLLLRLASLATPPERWRLREIDVHRMTLHAGVLTTEALDGRLGFDDLGVWSEGRFAAEDYVLETRVQDGQIQLAAHADSWKLGDSRLENPMISGLLSGSGLRDAQFGASWLSGALKGKLDLDLTGPVRLSGRLRMEGVSADSLGALAGAAGVVEGRLSGPVTLEARASSPDGLLDALVWSGSYAIADGALTRLDLLESMKRSGATPTAGGVTRFTRMEGDYQFEPGRALHFGIHRLDAGALKASGRFSVSDKGLQGVLRADLTTPIERFARMYSVDGAPASPILKQMGQ